MTLRLPVRMKMTRRDSENDVAQGIVGKKTPSTPNKSRTHDPGFREHRQQLTRHNVESMFLSIIFLKDITNFMISLFEPQGPTSHKTVLAPHVILGSYPFAKEKHRFLTVHLT